MITITKYYCKPNTFSKVANSVVLLTTESKEKAENVMRSLYNQVTEFNKQVCTSGMDFSSVRRYGGKTHWVHYRMEECA